MPRHKYMSECERRAQTEANRASERRIDKVRFVWFCAGMAFTILMQIVIELAFRQAGM